MSLNTAVPRRTLLRAVSAAAAAGLSGCFGWGVESTTDESEPNCTGFAQESERGPPLRNVKVVSWNGESATLRVTLVKSELDDTGAKWIYVYEPETNGSSPEYAIPLNVGDTQPTDLVGDGEVVYKEQTIGTMPVAGRFRVELETDDGTVLAWKEFSYDCSSESGRD